MRSGGLALGKKTLSIWVRVRVRVKKGGGRTGKRSQKNRVGVRVRERREVRARGLIFVRLNTAFHLMTWMYKSAGWTGVEHPCWFYYFS